MNDSFDSCLIGTCIGFQLVEAIAFVTGTHSLMVAGVLVAPVVTSAFYFCWFTAKKLEVYYE